MILDECSNVSATEEIPNDNAEFSEVDKNYIRTKCIEKHKEIIDRFYLVGSRPSILYVLSKIHNKIHNGPPSLCLFFSYWCKIPKNKQIFNCSF